MHRSAEKLRNDEEFILNRDDNRTLHESWHEAFTRSEIHKIHLARGLIFNPELLIMQRPVAHFRSDIADLVLGVLRQHVTCRGLGLPREEISIRRPRTLFFTAENNTQAHSIADVILNVGGGTIELRTNVPSRS